MLSVVTLVGWSTITLARDFTAVDRGRRFESLSEAQGLPHRTVFSIHQDRQGYLWFATFHGLVRFDGYELTSFFHDPNDPTSLANDNLSRLWADRDGSLWIATWGGGLDRYDPRSGTFEHHPPDPDDPNALRDGRVQTLFEDRDGDLWVGSFSGGLARRDRETGTFTTFRHDPTDPASLSHDRVWAITQADGRRLWVATEGGLSLFDPATGRSEIWRHDPGDPASLSDDVVRSLLVDRNGVLWVGTDRGLDRFDVERRAFERFTADPDDPTALSHPVVNTIHEDHRGDLWIGTGGGLNRFDRRTGAFERFLPDPDDPHSLSDDFVRWLLEDPAHNLWIATHRGGVNRLDLKPRKFLHVEHRPDRPGSLGGPLVHGFAEDAEGRLWVATDGGLDRYDETAGAFVHYRPDPADRRSLPAPEVLALAVDPLDGLWVAVWSAGLSRWEGETAGFRHFRHDPGDPASLSDDHVVALHVDRSGSLWAGMRGGLDRFNRETGGFDHWRHDPDDERSLSDNYVRVIYEDRRRRLWVGTDRGGLNRLDPRRRHVERFPALPGDPASLSNPTVVALYEDAAERLWVGTADGLNELRPDGTFRRYSTRDGLPANRIAGILGDGDGHLWVSTVEGLARFDPDRGTVRTYTTADGSQSHTFEIGSHFMDRSGLLYFGGEGGFNVFDPRAVSDNPHVPPLALTTVEVLGRPRTFDGSAIELLHGENILTFELAALDYTNPRGNRYRFRLEGLDPEWSAPGHDRRVRYAGLAPGTYVLHAQCSNNDGVWNEEGLSIPIRIAPPWWATWWSRSLAGLILGLAAFGAYRRRVRGLKQEKTQLTSVNTTLLAQIRQRERAEAQRDQLFKELRKKKDDLERFSFAVSHDLKNPLTTIRTFLGSIEKAARAGDSRRLLLDLQLVDDAALRMNELLDGFLEFSGLEFQKGEDEEVDLRDIAAEAVARVRARRNSRELQIEISDDLGIVRGVRSHLAGVFEELVDNAVKFSDSDPAQVEISVAARRGEKVYYVKDSGPGIARRHQSTIFGLFNKLEPDTEGAGVGLAVVQRIVEDMGGKIWVESKGRGSTFLFTLDGEI